MGEPPWRGTTHPAALGVGSVLQCAV